MEIELENRAHDISNKINKTNKKIDILYKFNRFFLDTMTIFGIVSCLALIGKNILSPESQIFDELFTCSAIPTSIAGIFFLPGFITESSFTKKRNKLQNELNDIFDELENYNEFKSEKTHALSKTQKKEANSKSNNYLKQVDYSKQTNKVKTYKRK